MKICQKLAEPSTLITYRQAQPNGTWEQMRNDPHHDGQQAYLDIKRTLVKGQRCLCAYCEMKIADQIDDESIHAARLKQRVEHFHPKKDRTGTTNWSLHWPNLWAVCQGGSQQPPDGDYGDPNNYLPPLPENLSCDAFKAYQTESNKSLDTPEGWILAPDEIPAFPLLFQFAPDGTPEPHSEHCSNVTLPTNRYSDTTILVSKTIEHLNLGCPRLNRNRRIAKAQLEKKIEQVRKQSPGLSSQTVMLNLARRLFSQAVNSPWPEFFSLLRWRLGEQAEAHLRGIQFHG